MANRFGIPIDIENEIRERDTDCVYCRRQMKSYHQVKGTRGDQATIEHFNLDGPFYWSHGLEKEDLAICCRGCNSSRGMKKLLEWFETPYCVERNINENTVANPVKKYIRRKYAHGEARLRSAVMSTDNCRVVVPLLEED